MTHIMERLREPIDPDDPDLWKVDRDRREAADEIERLRGLLANHDVTVPEILADNERLRGEVKQLRDVLTWTDQNCRYKCGAHARDVLVRCQG